MAKQQAAGRPFEQPVHEKSGKPIGPPPEAYMPPGSEPKKAVEQKEAKKGEDK